MLKNKGALLISFLFCFALLLTSCNKPKGGSSSQLTDNSSSLTSYDASVITSTETSSASTSSSKSSSTGSSPTSSTGMGGYTFTIASSWMTPEENMGEHTPLFERLFYERAHQVEKELNCKIKLINFAAYSSNLRTSIMAGKKIADLVESMPTWIPQNVAAGYLRDWNSVSGVNINDSTKFLSYANQVSTYNGKVYGISFLKPPEARYCVMFNKTLLEKNNIDANGIYDLVKNKQWTMDKLTEYAKAVTKDTNNDNKIDTYGIAGKPDYVANSFLAGYGASLVTNNGGKFVFSLNSTNAKNAMSKFYNLVNTDRVFWVQDAVLSPASHNTVDEQSYIQAFNTGKVAFLFWESWVLNQYTKAAANFDYGILPIPLGEGNTNYESPAQNMRVMCLTTTNKDVDKVVPIINALAKSVAGYENQNAWWDDIQSDYFQSKDTKSLDMYKLILNSSMRDPGLSVEALEQAFYENVVYNSIFWKNNTADAAIDSIKNTYTADIDNVYNKNK